MSERTFVDTNVFVYADDNSAGTKRERALALLSQLIGDGSAVISTQVLQEYFVVATRKLGVPADVARRKVEALARLDVVVVRSELILSAVDLHRLHAISFWDALVIRSAAAAGCSRVLTEDLNNGQVIDGIRVEDPFR